MKRKVASNPEAPEGLRKAVADVILAKAKSVTENGASGVENINAATCRNSSGTIALRCKAAGFSD